MRSGRRLEIIASAVDELPPNYREAFLLRVVCGWSFEAVSREMTVSERMVKVYVARALMEIQRRLDAEEAAG
jgi:RNA polymerase sigma factor (sigma-70 family)